MASPKKEGIKEIIDRIRRDNPDINELCLISKGSILYRNIDINCEEEYYVYNIESLISAGGFQLERISGGKEGITPNRIIIRLNDFSMIIHTIKGKDFIVVIYDHRNKDVERQMLNAIALEINNLKTMLAF